MPILLVILLAAHHERLGLFLGHLLLVRSLAVLTHLTIFYRFGEKVWRSRIVLNAVWNRFLHPYGLPVRKGAKNVGTAVEMPRLDIPLLAKLLDFDSVVSVNMDVLFASKKPDSRRPDEQSHGVVIANPALVLQARVDAPLRRSRHENFMAELALNDHLACIVAARHQRIHFMHSLRLNDVPQLDTGSDILPLLTF